LNVIHILIQKKIRKSLLNFFERLILILQILWRIWIISISELYAHVNEIPMSWECKSESVGM